MLVFIEDVEGLAYDVDGVLSRIDLSTFVVGPTIEFIVANNHIKKNRKILSNLNTGDQRAVLLLQ